MNIKSSAITLLIVVAIIAVVNFIVGYAGLFNHRFDLTEKHLYTLSNGTEKIIQDLDPDKPVTIRFYVTRDARIMPQFFQGYEATVEDLLMEFEKASKGKISVERIDVRPDTEAEDKAVADDIHGEEVNSDRDKFYFGLAVQCLQQKSVIPMLNPNEETALEYQVARAVTKVTRTKRTTLGVMSAMPIAGPAMNLPPMMRQQGQQQPWIVIQELRQDYDVREVPMTTDHIDSDIKVLLVVHPADISEKAQYAIDQYLLKGGKVVAFVDPECLVSQQYNSQGQFGMSQPHFTPPFSNMKTLFKAWGVGFTDQIVADMTFATSPPNRAAIPTFLMVNASGMNKNEPVTSDLEEVLMLSAGAFSIEKKEGITAVPLVESSENSAMIDSATADKSRREPLINFQSEGKKHVLVLRLSGKFKTAFPEGPPKDEAPGSKLPKLPGGTGGETKDAGAPAAAAQPAPGTPAAPAAPKSPAPAPAATATTPPVSVAPAPPAKPTTPPAAAKPAPGAPVPPLLSPKPATPPPHPMVLPPGHPAVPSAHAAPVVNSLKESQNGEGVVFLFSDVDMLFDSVAFQQPMPGMVVAQNSNSALLLNVLEMMSGGVDLIQVRSRGATRRPFTKIQELNDQVENAYRPRLEKLDAEFKETSQKITQLKVRQEKNGQLVLVDPKQRQDLEQANATLRKIKTEQRELKKEQTRGKDTLENWIKAINILLMPLIVLGVGLLIALRRVTLRAAK